MLYDFDYEVDRISLVQALLLMTYWYETPDDQKDTWHWMGVSLSLAHTIGLHRDPSNSGMGPRRKRLWKRIWWSTYTRDRLIALGMRRPMRVKDDDCDVPMLTIDDFEFKTYPPEILSMLDNCGLLRNVDQQRQLAMMFIEKAKLCLCVSHVLTAQYSVLSHRFGGTTETTMMLVPKKSSSETFQVRRCDQELEDWQANLPTEVQYWTPPSGSLTEAEESLHVHRALLRMIYLTTSSALHRPQVLPASPFPAVDAELQETSRNKVRYAAVEITNIAQGLHQLDLTRFLPTAGVTVLLPAVIIHLLDIKSNDPSVRMVSLQRFYQCMRILQRLREIYASADFATSFLEAAIRKAGIQINVPPAETAARPPPPPPPAPVRPKTLTPPPDSLAQKIPDLTYPDPTPSGLPIPEDGGMMFAATPPHSNGSENGSTQNLNPNAVDVGNFELTGNGGNAELSLDEFIDLANDAEVTQNDFDALINFDDGGADLFAAEDGLGLGLTNGADGNRNGGSGGSSGGFNFNMDLGQDFSENVLNLDMPGGNNNNNNSNNKKSAVAGSDATGLDVNMNMNMNLPKPKEHSLTSDLETDLGLALEA